MGPAVAALAMERTVATMIKRIFSLDGGEEKAHSIAIIYIGEWHALPL